jgi:hypothetical protein
MYPSLQLVICTAQRRRVKFLAGGDREKVGLVKDQSLPTAPVAAIEKLETSARPGGS